MANQATAALGFLPQSLLVEPLPDDLSLSFVDEPVSEEAFSFDTDLEPTLSFVFVDEPLPVESFSFGPLSEESLLDFLEAALSLVFEDFGSDELLLSFDFEELLDDRVSVLLLLLGLESVLLLGCELLLLGLESVLLLELDSVLLDGCDSLLLDE